jgi:H/ACA ribonucleoprotein complex subunit 3
MRYRIRRCIKCYRYTLYTTCPECGSETRIAHPPRFSPEDRYVKYRLLAKKISSEGSGV